MMQTSDTNYENSTEFLKPFTNWKLYVDLWNEHIFNMDNDNKQLFCENNQKILDSDLLNDNVDNLDNDKDDEQTNIYNNITQEDVITIISITEFIKNSDVDNLKNITKVLNWLINNCNIDVSSYQFFLNAIEWICNCITYFMIELKYPKTATRNFTHLVRSSYKLCPQKSNCMFQYPDDCNSKTTCKNQHFPYNSLFIDTTSIIYYIKNYFEKNILISSDVNNTRSLDFIKAITATQKDGSNDFNNDELKRCLTTINFVFIIITRELDTIIKCRSSEPNFNIRNFHSFKEPFKYEDKNTYKKPYNNSNNNNNNNNSRNKYNKKY